MVSKSGTVLAASQSNTTRSPTAANIKISSPLLRRKDRQHVTFFQLGPGYVTLYKITYTGEQVAQWYFQNNAPAFVLEVFCATCTPVYVILFHVTESCKGPIQGPII